ncbi:MAG: O-antigen ligase family protein [Patescibacteria group bacterium]|nr:O-antigen ligase family protein [Patescibacteria group bacterium]
MSIFPFTPLKTIFFSEIILVFAMIAEIVPQEFSYIILIMLSFSFLRLSVLDSLKLFIISIPFFVALPANQISDSMSVWRILIVILFLKVGLERYKNFHLELVASWLHSPEWLWSRCARLFNKQRFANRLHILTAMRTMEPTHILKQVQNDKINKLFFLTIFFFIIASISLISAQDIGMGIKKILFLVNIFLLFPIVVFAIQKESDLREVLKAVFYSSVTILSIGYFQFLSTFFFTLSQFWEFWTVSVIKTFYGQNLSYLLSYSNTWFSYYNFFPPTLRMFSVMPDSHSFSMMIIISIPVVLSFIFISPTDQFKRGIMKKKYLSVILILFFLAIFFSGSRGSWVGSVFALMSSLFLYLSASQKEKKYSRLEKILLYISELKKLLKSKVSFSINVEKNSKHYSKLLIFSVLLFYVLMPVASFTLKQNQKAQAIISNIYLSSDNWRSSSMFERAFSIYNFDETSNKGRIQIWKETITSIGKHPLLGAGFGNFNYVLGEKSTALKKGSSAHSVYLDIASEIGVFGLFIFLYILYNILKTAYLAYFKIEKKYLKIFAGSFFVYFSWICAYSFFDVVIFNDKVLMFIVVVTAILYSLNRITEKI